MSWKSATCAVVLLGSLPTSGSAADATVAQADGIKSGLERYLGHGPVTVTPAGAAYKIDIELAKVLAVLAPYGVRLDPVTYTLTATPQDDGQWHVVSGGLPVVTMHIRDMTTSVAVNNQHFDGLFDPRLPAFTQATGSYDSLSVGATGKDTTQARQLGHGQQTVAARPAGDGLIDLKLTQTNADYAQEIAFNAVQEGARIALKSGPTQQNTAIDGVHIRALADLWAFLVAHPDKSALTHDQAALKGLLRQALPVFGHWGQDLSFETASAATPFGPVLARSLALHLDLKGLTADGAANLALKADGLTIPTGPLPSWANALMPTGFDLHDGVSGYRLDQAAEAAIDNLDLAGPQPLPQATLDTIGRTIASRDTVTVTIGDSRITTPTVEARFGGEVHFAGPVPSFKVMAHATGLDKAIAAIRTKAGSDPTAAQAIGLIMLVKGYGQAGSDGAFTWDIVGDGTGSVTVNGAPLPVGPPK